MMTNHSDEIHAANPLLAALDDPPALERLYRGDPRRFVDWFAAASAARPDSPVLAVWRARLDFGGEAASTALSASRRLLGWAVLLALLAGVLLKLPQWLDWDKGDYYQHWGSVILCASVLGYWLMERAATPRVWLAATAGLGTCAMLAAALQVWARTLPLYDVRDALDMACLHLPILLLTLLGFVHMGTRWRRAEARMAFLVDLGELSIQVLLLLVGGGLLVALAAALFEATDALLPEQVLADFALFGFSAIPVLAAYLASRSDGRALMGRIAPLFAPLLLLVILLCLAGWLAAGRSVLEMDRGALIVLNALLVAVWLVVVFSLVTPGLGALARRFVQTLMVAALLLDLIALAAMLMRLGTLGLTPNRAVVLGLNLLLCGHLVWMFVAGAAVARCGDERPQQRAITAYLPAYPFWALVVCVLLPILFAWI